MKAAVVELSTNIVLNVIVANANVDLAPDGCVLIDITNGPDCSTGWIYDPVTQTFGNPQP